MLSRDTMHPSSGWPVPAALGKMIAIDAVANNGSSASISPHPQGRRTKDCRRPVDGGQLLTGGAHVHRPTSHSSLWEC